MIYGRIYKIYCNETGEYYFGSTEETLSRRLSVHKGDYKKWKKGKHTYTTSFRIIERGNFTISLLEEGEFQNKDFMKARERHYIENFECVNKVVPNRTPKEYRETHREQRAEYREANQEHIAEQTKKYRETHREQIAEYNKKYGEANREQIAKRKKIYNEKNKEQIAEQKAQKYTCVCGCVIRRDSKAKHEKSKKHINYLAINIR